MPAYVSDVGTWNTTAGSHAATVVAPTVGNTIFVMAGYTGGTASSGSVSDNQAGGTYTKISTANKNAGADTMEFFIRNALISTTTDHIVTQADPPGTDTGGGLVAIQISGITTAGIGAVVQFKALSNQTVNGTPSVTFDAAVNTANMTIGAVMHTINSATQFTAAAGWTEQSEIAYATPATAEQIVTRDSGFSGTVMGAWVGTATQPWCAMVVELQASAAVVSIPDVTRARVIG